MEYYLKHHGILGQKWGKKNGPPYPLDAEDHSAAEKKIGYKKSLNGNHNDNLYQRKQSDNVNKRSSKTTISKEQIDKHRKTMMLHHANNPSKKKLYENATDEQIAKDIENRENLKNIALAVAAGTAVVGTTLAVAYLYRKHNLDVVSAALNEKANNIDNLMSSDPTLTLDSANSIMEVRSNTSKSGLLDYDDMIKLHQAAKDDIDVAFQEGAVFARVNFKKDFDLDKARDAIFVDPSKNDHEFYFNALGDFTGKNETKNSVKLKATNTINTPGFEKTKKMLAELYNDPEFKKDVELNIRDLMAKNYNARMPLFKIDANNPMVVKAARDLMNNGRDSYNIILAMGGDSTELNSKIAKSFIDKGYHAIWDFHDIEDGLTKTPIILLDKSRVELDRIDKRPS